MMDAVQRYFYAKDIPLCEDVVSVVLCALAQLCHDYDPAIYDAEAYLHDRNWSRRLEQYVWSPRERDSIIMYYHIINEHHMVCDVRRLLHLNMHYIVERLTWPTVDFLEGSSSREQYCEGVSRWFTSPYPLGVQELSRLRVILSTLKHTIPRAKVQAAIDVIKCVQAKKIGK